MEAVIFIGLQASGKSSFYKAQFFTTHLRINLDMLRTRHRERRLLETCLAIQQRFVVDNTNPIREERAIYIAAARAAGFGVVGYYFQSRLAECLQRNEMRPDALRVPAKAIVGTSRRMQVPTPDEGFDLLYYVLLEP